MDALDQKLNAIFPGKAVRKDLLHRIKKGTNVPTFVLEFLLARYCASDEPEEIRQGLDAVLATLHDSYVRPDEANAAQSKVATKGRHRFIDKVHVRYVEKERKHWASLENFNSQRIAIGDKFFRENDRLLEGGIWAEISLAYNDVDQDNYAFYIEDLRPIQLSRFDYAEYCEGNKQFTRDEWMDIILRSVGLEPTKLGKRLKFHYMARLASLVESNYNFIELGPRGTGKSYFFSEFSPYATLISGGQATKATLFYNTARNKVGLVGFWDTVAFDEVGGITIRDPDTMQIMKDYMANGRFSRGVEVIADASLAFVGNIDQSVDQIVHSPNFDLFQPLPKEFDLAIMDRFAAYVPGWEFPKNSSEYLTSNYGFITDYLAEAYHYQLKHHNRYEEVNSRAKLGHAVEGRDEKSIKKTVAAFLKILHPGQPATNAEFEEYLAYAVESRRRVKEQMNKRKTDDEFARINLSYFSESGEEIIVYCPESKTAQATQHPIRKELDGPTQARRSSSSIEPLTTSLFEANQPATPPAKAPVAESPLELKEKHYTIFFNDTGYTYESILMPYAIGIKEVIIEEPYLRQSYQRQYLVHFCEALLKVSNVQKIHLVTGYDEDTEMTELQDQLEQLKQSLLENDVTLEIELQAKMHDREIRLGNGWVIKIGRGLNFYQKPEPWFGLGAFDLSLRKCLETKVDIYKL